MTVISETMDLLGKIRIQKNEYFKKYDELVEKTTFFRKHTFKKLYYLSKIETLCEIEEDLKRRLKKATIFNEIGL